MAQARLRRPNRAQNFIGISAQLLDSPHLFPSRARRMIAEAMTTTEAYEELRKRVAPATTLRLAEPLAKRTTLRVGGPAEIYVEPASETELSAIFQFTAANDLPWMALGRGSNLLIRDGGI